MYLKVVHGMSQIKIRIFWLSFAWCGSMSMLFLNTYFLWPNFGPLSTTKTRAKLMSLNTASWFNTIAFLRYMILVAWSIVYLGTEFYSKICVLDRCRCLFTWRCFRWMQTTICSVQFHLSELISTFSLIFLLVHVLHH